jgi:hypothetical protein
VVHDVDRTRDVLAPLAAPPRAPLGRRPVSRGVRTVPHSDDVSGADPDDRLAQVLVGARCFLRGLLGACLLPCRSANRRFIERQRQIGEQQRQRPRVRSCTPCDNAIVG